MNENILDRVRLVVFPNDFHSVLNVDRLGRSIHNYINYIGLDRVTLEEYSNE